MTSRARHIRRLRITEKLRDAIHAGLAIGEIAIIRYGQRTLARGKPIRNGTRIKFLESAPKFFRRLAHHHPPAPQIRRRTQRPKLSRRREHRHIPQLRNRNQFKPISLLLAVRNVPQNESRRLAIPLNQHLRPNLFRANPLTKCPKRRILRAGFSGRISCFRSLNNGHLSV